MQAGTIHAVSVKKQDGAYEVRFDVTVTSEQTYIYARLLDFDRFHELSDIIVRSERVVDAPRQNRRLLEAQACFLFYCPEFILLEDIAVSGNRFTARVVPNDDFYSGLSHWAVEAEADGQSRVIFNSTIRPAFWIPPLIGPWLLENRLSRELVVMIQRLELNEP